MIPSIICRQYHDDHSRIRGYHAKEYRLFECPMATESVVSQGGSLLDGDRYLSPKSLIAEYPPRVFDRSGSRRRWIPASTVRSTESVILLPRISLFFSMAQG